MTTLKMQAFRKHNYSVHCINTTSVATCTQHVALWLLSHMHKKRAWSGIPSAVCNSESGGSDRHAYAQYPTPQQRQQLRPQKHTTRTPSVPHAAPPQHQLWSSAALLFLRGVRRWLVGVLLWILVRICVWLLLFFLLQYIAGDLMLLVVCRTSHRTCSEFVSSRRLLDMWYSCLFVGQSSRQTCTP